MPELTIHIGGRSFEVACHEGEEEFLQSAAKMLDDEAQALASQIGRLPETRMLLMAGLMLADKTAAGQDSIAEMQQKLEAAEKEIADLKSGDAVAPQTVEVEVIPSHVTDSLANLAARAEALADKISTV
ncbi:MAG: cell division protein ZapA [Rhodobacteraceae bacterium]|jgi:cell division protein ZapA|nr:cell division protein ZapA [Paracoccaceae bacterium]